MTSFPPWFEEYRRGNWTACIDLLSEELRTASDQSEVHGNMASCYNQLGQFALALEHGVKAVELNPANHSAWNAIGNAHERSGNPTDALDAYGSAVNADPASPVYQLNQASLLIHLGRETEALLGLDQLLRTTPIAEAFFLRGLANWRLGRKDSVRLDMGRAIGLKPKNPEPYKLMTELCLETGAFSEALRYAEACLEVAPNDFDGQALRGRIFHSMRRFGDAIEEFHKCLAQRPNDAPTLNCIGNSYRELLDLSSALLFYRKALAEDESLREAELNAANALREMGRFEDALQSYDEVIRKYNDWVEARYDRCLVLMLLERFETPALDYSTRWSKSQMPVSIVTSDLPFFCIGVHRRPLIWAEQGLGDEIFFARFLLFVSQKVERLTVACDVRLHDLLRRSLPLVTFLDRRLPSHSSLFTEFDSQLPFADLLFCSEGVLDAGRTAVPYIVSDPQLVPRSLALLADQAQQCLCGVSWRSRNPVIGASKTLRLEDDAVFLGCQAVTFINLQYGLQDRSELERARKNWNCSLQELDDLDPESDIDRLASTISALDVVVTTSNVTAHIAGALGKRTAVLVPFGGLSRIWYWHVDQVFSSWYPNSRIFYQKQAGDWRSVCEEVRLWLEAERSR